MATGLINKIITKNNSNVGTMTRKQNRHHLPPGLVLYFIKLEESEDHSTLTQGGKKIFEFPSSYTPGRVEE
jgi:hypothetical protein